MGLLVLDSNLLEDCPICKTDKNVVRHWPNPTRVCSECRTTWNAEETIVQQELPGVDWSKF